MTGQAAVSRLRRHAESRSAMPAADISVIDSLAGFDALERPWRELADRAAAPHNLFQDFGFVRHWAKHYLGPSDRLAIIVARRGRNATAILPLVRRRMLGIETLRFMGAPIARFNDMLAEPEAGAAMADDIRQALQATGAHLIEAPLVRDDSALVRLGLDRDGVVVQSDEALHALLDRRVAGDGPGDAYDARTRSNYRRRLRRLAESGSVELKHYPPGAEAAMLAREAIRMKKAWLERSATAGPAVFDPRFEACFAAMAADADLSASLRVATIERDGQPIGIDLSFDFGGSSFGHVIATDEAAEKDGAGSVLVHHVFAAAKARGSTRFELLTPADAHKRRHADGGVGVRDLLIPLTPLGGVAAMAMGQGLPLAKSLVKRLPGGFVRAIAARTGQ